MGVSSGSVKGFIRDFNSQAGEWPTRRSNMAANHPV
jgi:hypothetical protein